MFPRRRVVQWNCWGVLGQLLVLLLAEGLVSLLRLLRVFRCFWFVCLLIERCFCLFPVLWWGMVSFPRCWVVPLGAWGQVEPACPVGKGGCGALFFRLFSRL